MASTVRNLKMLAFHIQLAFVPQRRTCMALATYARARARTAISCARTLSACGIPITYGAKVRTVDIVRACKPLICSDCNKTSACNNNVLYYTPYWEDCSLMKRTPFLKLEVHSAHCRTSGSSPWAEASCWPSCNTPRASQTRLLTLYIICTRVRW